MSYCIECGHELIEKELEEEGLVPYCSSCDQYRFSLYNVAVSMIVIDPEKDKILLIQQYSRPSYVLLAGYVNRGERAEDAVVREIKEETNLDVNHIRFNRTKFFERSNTLMCNFTAYITNPQSLSCNGEIDYYSWFSPQEARKNIRPQSLAEEFLCSFLDERGSEDGI